METVNFLKNIDDFSEYYSTDYKSINKQEIKNVSKELCRAYKNGSLPDSVFREIFERLLVFYIEHDLEEKLLSKFIHFDEKLFKSRQYHHR